MRHRHLRHAHRRTTSRLASVCLLEFDPPPSGDARPDGLPRSQARPQPRDEPLAPLPSGTSDRWTRRIGYTSEIALAARLHLASRRRSAWFESRHWSSPRAGVHTSAPRFVPGGGRELDRTPVSRRGDAARGARHAGADRRTPDGAHPAGSPRRARARGLPRGGVARAARGAGGTAAAHGDRAPGRVARGHAACAAAAATARTSCAARSGSASISWWRSMRSRHGQATSSGGCTATVLWSATPSRRR